MNFLSINCPDCVNNIDLTDRNSIIACAITIVVGAVVRFIEKRKDRKNKR